MQVFKRKGTPNWYFKFTINGQRVYKSTGTTNKMKAQEIADNAKSEAWGIIKGLARHPTSCNSGTPVALINSLTERLGNALVRPASASTSHKSRYVKATSNGLTAIRNAILASLACS